MMDCKQALTEAKGDMEQAVVILRKKGVSVAAKKGDARDQRRRGDQLHSRRRQDWCARRSELRERFRGPHRRLQGTGARYRHAHRGQRSEVRAQGRCDQGRLRRAKRKSISAQAVASGKPQNIAEKMVAGKMGKFYEEVCLLEQPFIKDQTVSIAQLIAAKIGKLGENISVRRFARFKVGDLPARRSRSTSQKPENGGEAAAPAVK